jgi:hypothetical protein
MAIRKKLVKFPRPAPRTKKNSQRLSKVQLKAVRSVWDLRRVTIGWRWAAGKDHLSQPATSSPKPGGKFRLYPKVLRTGAGKIAVQYRVMFADGAMPEAWRHLLLTPLGTDTPPVREGSLPEWDGKVTTELKIQKALLRLFVEMGDPNTRIQRLEAFYPVPSASGYAIDVVRLVHLKKALVNGNDVVAVYFNYFQDGVVGAQNGGGSGPPH